MTHDGQKPHSWQSVSILAAVKGSGQITIIMAPHELLGAVPPLFPPSCEGKGIDCTQLHMINDNESQPQSSLRNSAVIIAVLEENKRSKDLGALLDSCTCDDVTNFL